MALLGCGVVGSQVARLLRDNADELEQRCGARLELIGALVQDPTKPRDGIPASLLTADADEVLQSGAPDIVVELIGGIEPARSLLLRAIAAGASVVTANKALLAHDGATVHDAAAQQGVDVAFEASVAGAIPLLRPLKESLAGDRVDRVLGIVNGTTNYILTRMDEAGVSYADALREAQDLGYAEADPTADVEGHDAAAKAAILASLAFHTRVRLEDVAVRGISHLTAADIAAARAMSHVIKLLAVAERSDDGGIGVRVAPAMVPLTHPLASVREAYNAVFVEARAAGQLMFYGRGAGGAPTASAVLGDIVSLARNRVLGGRDPGESAYAQLPISDPGSARSRHYLSIAVQDRTGVLAKVASTLADHGVSIETLRQDGRGADAVLTIVTHSSSAAEIKATVAKLRALDEVRDVASVMQVVGD
ncbi:MAG TPA: homoserine dehydrogenase [Actinobacteria bacterium]|nr:homoserine dehydrogenase [Actinomycetota bacterium]